MQQIKRRAVDTDRYRLAVFMSDKFTGGVVVHVKLRLLVKHVVICRWSPSQPSAECEDTRLLIHTINLLYNANSLKPQTYLK